MNAVSEALRVLKPGGELQLHPWISTIYKWDKNKEQNARELTTYLREKNIAHFVEAVDPIVSPRLRIVKSRV